MKVVAFKVPKNEREAFRLQVDDMPHLYDKLHQHPEIQITLVEESAGTLIAGDYVGRFAPGDIFILGSNLPHVFKNEAIYYQQPDVAKARAISVFFDAGSWGKEFWLLTETQHLKEFIRQTKRGFQVGGSLKEAATPLIRKLLFSKDLQRLIYLLELMALFHLRKAELQYLSLYERNDEMRTEEGERMNNIIQFTLNESGRFISLKEIASVANMTREAFCRYFKERTRKTYVSFLNEIRISNACRLLMDPQQTKASIAYEVGFNNLSHFNRVFKKVMGKTPSEYQMEL
jgi:AraC-like DNA-binding protein